MPDYHLELNQELVWNQDNHPRECGFLQRNLANAVRVSANLLKKHLHLNNLKRDQQSIKMMLPTDCKKSDMSCNNPPTQQHRPSTLNPQNEVENKCVANQCTHVGTSQKIPNPQNKVDSKCVASQRNHVGNHQTNTQIRKSLPQET
jgi:hypothetical protein